MGAFSLVNASTPFLQLFVWDIRDADHLHHQPRGRDQLQAHGNVMSDTMELKDKEVHAGSAGLTFAKALEA